MKQKVLFLAAVMLFVAGCNYIVPLAKEHSISVDQNVLGLWERIPDETKAGSRDEKMLILEYSDTEYLGCYQSKNATLYFRGYPINIEGMSCVQVQLIGTSKGDIAKEHRKYQVLSYRLSNGELEVEMLNIDVVDKDLQTTPELRQAFLKHKEDEDLFKEAARFKKAGKKD